MAGPYKFLYLVVVFSSYSRGDFKRQNNIACISHLSQSSTSPTYRKPSGSTAQPLRQQYPFTARMSVLSRLHWNLAQVVRKSGFKL